MESENIGAVTPTIPITRNIDGFEFINRSVHLGIVNNFAKKIQERDRLLSQAKDRAKDLIWFVTYHDNKTLENHRPIIEITEQFLKDLESLK